MKLHNLLLFFIIFSTSAYAVDVQTQSYESKNYLSAGLEFAQFTLEGGSLNGTSVKVDFSHYFTPKWGIEVFLASAVNASSGGASNFTTLGGYFNYTLLGNCCSIQKTISMDGSPIVVETSSKKNQLKVGVGIDQVFLNGSKSVYSISGVGAGASYEFRMFDYPLKASGRYSMMSSGAMSISGIFFGLGMTFGL